MPGLLEVRSSYALFALLGVIDLLILGRIVTHLSVPGRKIPADAPMFFVSLIALQGLILWLSRRLRAVIRYYQALKTSYEQELDFTRQLMDASGSGMAVLDEHGRFVYANAMAATLLGVTPEGLLGRTLLEHAAPDECEALRRKQEDHWNGETTQCTLTVTPAGSGPRSLNVHGSPRWYRGRIVGSLLTMTRISETLAP